MDILGIVLSVIGCIAGLLFVGYALVVVFKTYQKYKPISAEAERQARKERFLKGLKNSPTPRYTINQEYAAQYEREQELKRWREDVRMDEEQAAWDVATRIFKDDAWVLPLAKKMRMHKTESQIDLVFSRAWDVVNFAHEKAGGRLTVEPLYLYYREDDTILPKLRARRFYEGLGVVLGDLGLAERPSKKEGWRLSEQGIEHFGFNPQVYSLSPASQENDPNGIG
jgi:hypothetical protein